MSAALNIFTSNTELSAKLKSSRVLNSADLLFNFLFDDKSPKEDPHSNLGSGVLVIPKVIIRTNHHIINDADEVDITPADGRKFKAKLIGSDLDADIAVIKA